MFKDLDLSKMGEIISKMQKEAEEYETKSSQKEFISKSGGGLINVKCNGKLEILDINIDDSLLDDKESLQILLISAINDVLSLAESEKKNLAAEMFGGFNRLGI